MSCLRPFLMVVHQRHSVTGRLGRKLQERGFALDVRRPMQGERLPDTLDRHAGVAIFGGPMSANDDHLEGLRQELHWLDTALASAKPVLGICLGAQLIARALGVAVKPHNEGLVEIGYYPVAPTEADPDFLQDQRWFYQWHRDGFEIPTGATRLATGQNFDNQAFRIGDSVYGLQFHPEVTTDMMMRWLRVAYRMLTIPGARPAEAHRADNVLHDAHIDQWLDHFLDLWLMPDGRDH